MKNYILAQKLQKDEIEKQLSGIGQELVDLDKRLGNFFGSTAHWKLKFCLSEDVKKKDKVLTAIIDDLEKKKARSGDAKGDDLDRELKTKKEQKK